MSRSVLWSTGGRAAPSPDTTPIVFPAFRPGARDAAWDLALVRVGAGPSRAVPLASGAELLPGNALEVGLVSESGDVRWLERTVRESDPLRVTIEDQDGRVCRGHSGAPVRATVGGSLQLVGVVATGDPACTGSVRVARLPPLAAR